MDPISGNSLASRVCSSNAGIELSEDKSSAFKALKAYLNHDNGFPIGPAFKCLCILVWCLTVLSDLFSAIKLMTAAYQLRGSQTLIALDASGQRQVKSISKPRLMWFLVVQSIRAGVSLYLGFGGTLFLLGTVALQDLLLNVSMSIENLGAYFCARVNVICNSVHRNFALACVLAHTHTFCARK